MKRHPREQIIYALFNDPAEMERTFDELIAAGISIDDVSLLLSADAPHEDFKPLLEKHLTLRGATAGGLFGATLGGMIGGMVAVGAATSPIGVLVLGPAIALATTGGLLGGLAGHAVRSHEAERLHNAVGSGEALMAVHVHTPLDIAVAARVLRREVQEGHAENIVPAV